MVNNYNNKTKLMIKIIVLHNAKKGKERKTGRINE